MNLVTIALALSSVVLQAQTDAKLVGVLGLSRGSIAYWKPDGTRLKDIPVQFMNRKLDVVSQQKRRILVFSVPDMKDAGRFLLGWKLTCTGDPGTADHNYPRTLMPVGGSDSESKRTLMTCDLQVAIDTKTVDADLTQPTSAFDVLWSSEDKDASTKLPTWHVFTLGPTGFNGHALSTEELAAIRPIFAVCIEVTEPNVPDTDRLSAVAKLKDGKVVSPSGMSASGWPGDKGNKGSIMRFDFPVTSNEVESFEVRKLRVKKVSFSKIALDPIDASSH